MTHHQSDAVFFNGSSIGGRILNRMMHFLILRALDPLLPLRAAHMLRMHIAFARILGAMAGLAQKP